MTLAIWLSDLAWEGFYGDPARWTYTTDYINKVWFAAEKRHGSMIMKARWLIYNSY